MFNAKLFLFGIILFIPVAIFAQNHASGAQPKNKYKYQKIKNISAEKSLTDIYSFHLDQNYPNPFNSQSKIKFTVAFHSNVSINLYDALGEFKALVANGYYEPGNYETEISGNNLASGVYFLQMRADRFTAVRKIMLLK